jgi:archaellum component FlaC
MKIGRRGKKGKKGEEKSPSETAAPMEGTAGETTEDKVEERTIEVETGLPTLTIDAAQAQAIQQGTQETAPEQIEPPQETPVLDEIKKDFPTTPEGESKKTVREKVSSRRIDEIENMLKEIRERMNQVDAVASGVRNEIEEIRESVIQMEGSIARVDEIRDGFSTVERSLRELSALYDLVSSQINPFIKADISGGDTTQKRIAEGSTLFGKELSGGGRGGGEYIYSYPSEVWVLKWTEYLLEQMDENDIKTLLDYYKQINWVDDTIASKVLAYIAATRVEPSTVDIKKRKKISDRDDVVVKPDGTTERASELKLTADEHLRSLMFIERIRGRRFTDEDMKSLQDDVSKLKKGGGGIY